MSYLIYVNDERVVANYSYWGRSVKVLRADGKLKIEVRNCQRPENVTDEGTIAVVRLVNEADGSRRVIACQVERAWFGANIGTGHYDYYLEGEILEEVRD